MASYEEPNKFANGKIYQIICNITGEVYIGSTTYSLEERLAQHHFKNNRACSKQILERGDYCITLVEEYPCGNTQELLWRERHYYDTVKCINKVPPIVTEEEEKLQRKQYREAHKQKQAEYMKKWRADNAEKLKKDKAKWQQDNKEAIAEKSKEYREKNAETLKVKKAEQYQKLKEKGIARITCGCGGTYMDRGGSRNRHMTFQKHIKWAEAQTKN